MTGYGSHTFYRHNPKEQTHQLYVPQVNQEERSFYPHLQNPTHLRSPFNDRNMSPFIHNQIPGRQSRSPTPLFRENFERPNPQFNFQPFSPRPPLETHSYYNPDVNQFNSMYGCRTQQPNTHTHLQNPQNNLCNGFNAMSLNNQTRVPLNNQTRAPLHQQAPPVPQRRSPPLPINPTPPPSYNGYSHHTPPSNSTYQPSMLDIHGESITMLMPSSMPTQHGLEDMPLWADCPMENLPKSTFDFICHRLDNISYCERNWLALLDRRGYSLSLKDKIRASRNHTAQLLECWRPKLHEFIRELNEIDCKKLVSEIIHDLKCAPSPIHSRCISPVQSIYGTSNPYSAYKPHSTIQRPEVEQWSYRQAINTHPSVTSSSPPNPSMLSPSPLSSLSPPTSLSSSSSQNNSLNQEDLELDAEIFVSYDKKDEEIGQEVVKHVSELNYKVACEDDLVAGKNELMERTKLIKKCRITIGIISPDYLKDDLPFYEAIAGVSKSVTGMKGTFIPLYVRKVDNVPVFITGLRGVQWSDAKKWDRLKKSLAVRA